MSQFFEKMIHSHCSSMSVFLVYWQLKSLYPVYIVLIQVQIISRQYSSRYKPRFVFAISSKTIVSILKFFRKSSSSMGSITSLGSFFVSSSQSIMVHEFHNNNWLQKNYGYNKFPDVLASYSNIFLHRSIEYRSDSKTFATLQLWYIQFMAGKISDHFQYNTVGRWIDRTIVSWSNIYYDRLEIIL